MGGLQTNGRPRHLGALRRACLIAFLYCLRQQIGKERKGCIIRDVRTRSFGRNIVLCFRRVCKSRTNTKQLLIVVN